MARLSFSPHRLAASAFVGFVALTFLIGGGSRPDVYSLVLLRPLAVVACGYGLWVLTPSAAHSYRHLFWFAGAVFAITILHLLPLPPAIWTALPGRELIVQIDALTGNGAIWRPLSIAPSATWNALFSLFVPLAVLLLGAGIDQEERYRLLPLLIGFGALSGLLGLAQVAGDPGGPLYFYRYTNNGSAVGLFANRNHAATLLSCLFPMLAVYASTTTGKPGRMRYRGWVAVGIGIVVVPLILVTGSRAGLVTGTLGLLSVPLLYQRPGQRTGQRTAAQPRIWLSYGLGLAAVVGIGVVFAFFSRAAAVQRLLHAGQGDDLRFRIWGPIAEVSSRYFPFGSGIGSFVEVYQVHEPYALLSRSYANHAHNDWLEVYLTAGLPGALLLSVTVVALLLRSYRIWRTPASGSRSLLFARMASVILLLLALASIGDYPLRTPSMMALFVLCALWLYPTSRLQRSTPSTPIAPADAGPIGFPRR